MVSWACLLMHIYSTTCTYVSAEVEITNWNDKTLNTFIRLRPKANIFRRLGWNYVECWMCIRRVPILTNVSKGKGVPHRPLLHTYTFWIGFRDSRQTPYNPHRLTILYSLSWITTASEIYIVLSYTLYNQAYTGAQTGIYKYKINQGKQQKWKQDKTVTRNKSLH